MNISVLQPQNLSAIQAVRDIYNDGILMKSVTFETKLKDIDDIQAKMTERHPFLVAEKNGKIIGFCSASPFSERECYAGVAEVSIYVDKRHRKQGVGRKLLEEMIEYAYDEDRKMYTISGIFPAFVLRYDESDIDVKRRDGATRGAS